MRNLPLLLLFVANAANAAAQQSSPPPPPPASSTSGVSVPPGTQDLSAVVRAAKESKAKRSGKRSPRKVITNANVHKSKGKVMETPPEMLGKMAPDVTGLRVRSRAAAEERLRAAEKSVATAEAELEAIERSYYEDSDFDHRDKMIRRRFSDTKQRLAEARQELADARDAAAPARP